MTSPLQKWPAGLLSVFDLKTLGEAPNLFGDTVAPTIETLDFYVRDQVAVSRTITNGGGASTSLQQIQTVPKGEVWVLYGVEGNPFLPAADAAEATDTTIRLQIQGGSALLVARELYNGASLALQSRFAYCYFPRPVILREADAVVTTCNNVTAAATFSANFDLIVQTLRATLRA